MMNDLNVIFMGTPEFAVPVLEKLIENTRVIAVVTQPDKEVGRHHELKASPIKELALAHDIRVIQPNKIREEYQEIVNLNPDIIITCAYGQIIPDAILECPHLGCINVHASLLPKLRGGAPIHHAIIDGYNKTGITIMYMDSKMDTGDIIAQRECPIYDIDNVGTLHDKLSKIGAELLMDTLPSLLIGAITRTKQNDEEATFAWNIKREEEHVDFNDTARNIFNKIRGLYPFPTANCIINDQEVKLLECYIGETESSLSPCTICEVNKDNFGIATKDKIIYITKVKPFGKKEMDAKDYINGIKKENLLHTFVK